MTTKRKILFVIAVLFVVLWAGCVYVVRPFFVINQLERRYKQTQQGMGVEEVQRLMAHSEIRASNDWFSAWDDEPLPAAEAARIVSAFRISVKTFYLPVIFEFTFDVKHRLVGRHICD